MKNNQQGFTLVELAVVALIVGILIAGVLKAREMVDSARAVDTIAQAQSYSAALNTFRRSYNAVPGDMIHADTRLQGCNANCSNADTVTGAGDGIIGDPTLSYEQTAQPTLQQPPASSRQEVLLFWIHLLKANLITGVTDEALNGSVAPEWGITNPAAAIGGGFVVSSGSRVNNLVPGTPRMFPFEVILTGNANQDIQTAAGSNALSAHNAMIIDRKIDDGRPDAGNVRAVGDLSACSVDAGGGARRYNGDAPKTDDCSLIFKL